MIRRNPRVVRLNVADFPGSTFGIPPGAFPTRNHLQIPVSSFPMIL
jgi:hypothetical protein